MCHFTVCPKREARSQGEIKFPPSFPHLLVVRDRRSGLTRASPSRSSWDPRKAVSLGLRGQAGLATARFLSEAPLSELPIGMLLAVPVTPVLDELQPTRLLYAACFRRRSWGINGPITLLYFSDEGASRETEGNGTMPNRAR